MNAIVRAPQRFEPGSFEPPRHFYPKVLNAHIHPLVRDFIALGNRWAGIRRRANREGLRRSGAGPARSKDLLIG